MTKPPEPGFNHLLYEACHAAEAVDYFDLRSEQPANAAAFNWLEREAHQSATALVQYVMTHGADILTHLGEPPDAPTEPPGLLLSAVELSQARHNFLAKYATDAEAAARTLDGIEHPRQYRRLKFAHGYSIGNRRLIEQGGPCGCFYCLKTFDAGAVIHWVDPADDDDGQTALCPHCGIDAVLSAKAAPIDDLFLRRMNARWFSVVGRRVRLPT